jgi:hypothetical protein
VTVDRLQLLSLATVADDLTGDGCSHVEKRSQGPTSKKNPRKRSLKDRETQALILFAVDPECDIFAGTCSLTWSTAAPIKSQLSTKQRHQPSYMSQR